jgi:hypothetical protein
MKLEIAVLNPDNSGQGETRLTWLFDELPQPLYPVEF